MVGWVTLVGGLGAADLVLREEQVSKRWGLLWLPWLLLVPLALSTSRLAPWGASQSCQFVSGALAVTHLIQAGTLLAGALALALARGLRPHVGPVPAGPLPWRVRTIGIGFALFGCLGMLSLLPRRLFLVWVPFSIVLQVVLVALERSGSPRLERARQHVATLLLGAAVLVAVAVTHGLVYARRSELQIFERLLPTWPAIVVLLLAAIALAWWRPDPQRGLHRVAMLLATATLSIPWGMWAWRDLPAVESPSFVDFRGRAGARLAIRQNQRCAEPVAIKPCPSTWSLPPSMTLEGLAGAMGWGVPLLVNGGASFLPEWKSRSGRTVEVDLQPMGASIDGGPTLPYGPALTDAIEALEPEVTLRLGGHPEVLVQQLVSVCASQRPSPSCEIVF